MKWNRLLTTLAIGLLLPAAALGWNTAAMPIDAVEFLRDGSIRFKLFDPSGSGKNFYCDGSATWMVVPACESGDSGCLAAVDRMASALLAAKVAGRAVHVERGTAPGKACEVSAVALDP